MDLVLRGGGEQSVELGLGASDPARELGGAFGIALLGRIDNTAYPSNIDLSGIRLSAGGRAIAGRFSDGEALTAQAASAFTDTFKVANWISIGIAVAAPRDPRRRTPRGSRVLEAASEDESAMSRGTFLGRRPAASSRREPRSTFDRRPLARERRQDPGAHAGTMGVLPDLRSAVTAPAS